MKPPISSENWVCPNLKKFNLLRNHEENTKLITNNNNPEEDVDMEELLEEFEENLKEEESQEVQTNYKSERVNKHNPVKDKQSFISRIFQGRTDRY